MKKRKILTSNKQPTSKNIDNLNLNARLDNEQLAIPNQTQDLQPTSNLANDSFEEPSGIQLITRLLIESLFVFFLIGIHWLLKLSLEYTKFENEWWAKFLLTITVWFAIISFTVIFGCEVIINCKRAIKYTWTELWK